MFYCNEYGQSVRVMNHKPKNLSKGGMIRNYKDTYTIGNQRFLQDADNDTILSNLPVGCLVIPRSVVPLMNKYDGKITGPIIKKHLEPTLVEYDEIVVHPQYSNRVIKFLKSHGITLPLTDDIV